MHFACSVWTVNFIILTFFKSMSVLGFCFPSHQNVSSALVRVMALPCVWLQTVPPHHVSTLFTSQENAALNARRVRTNPTISWYAYTLTPTVVSLHLQRHLTLFLFSLQGPNCYVDTSRSQVIPAGEPVWVNSCTKCRCHDGQDAGYWEGNRLATCSHFKNCTPEQLPTQQNWFSVSAANQLWS